MQATKMNANSRRILERKLKTTTAAANDEANANTDGGAIISGQLVNGGQDARPRSNVERVQATRTNRGTKKVPTQSLDLSFSSNRKQNIVNAPN